MNNSVHPKEVYLLEKFSSLDFFETMRNNYHNFNVVPLIRPLNSVL